MRETVAFVVLLGGLMVAVAHCTAGCTSSTQRQAAAESTYAADLMRCVDDASTLAESKACRARVRAAWHVDGGAQ